MIKKLLCIFIALCVFVSNVAISEAVLSETVDLAVNAASGMLQEDDKKLEQKILKGLSDNGEKEKLRKYVEDTRPIIRDKKEFFQGTLFLGMAWVYQKSSILGSLLDLTLIKVYMLYYEHTLSNMATDNTLKAFAELREHNIEAGQGIFEVFCDTSVKPYDQDAGSAKTILDGMLFAVKETQQYDRYVSSAVAIANTLKYAGIPMEDCDTADICSNLSMEQIVNNANNTVNKNTVKENNANDTKTQTRPKEQVKQEKSRRSTSDDMIGGVKLGDSLSDVSQTLGEPIKKTDKGENQMRYEYKSMDVAYDSGSVIGLATDVKSVSTPRGIHAGSSINEVLDKYGQNYILSVYDNLDLYEYKLRDENNKSYILRFAVEQGNSSVKYISIRYGE